MSERTSAENVGTSDPATVGVASAAPQTSKSRAAAQLANAAASDWQIIVYLKTLIQREPDVLALLLDTPASASRTYLATVLAAAREAYAARPACGALRGQLERAAARLGATSEGRTLLGQVLGPGGARQERE
jgi:hypothetical protein